MDKKNTWGGSRPNSGRKKTGNVAFCCRMSQASVDRIKELARSEGLAAGEYIAKQLGV